MAPRSEREWAEDILRAVDLVQEHRRAHAELDPAISGSMRTMLVDALAYRLMSIGEAAKQLSTTTREQHPSVPWGNVIGMRDFLAHHYHRRDDDVVLATVDGGFLEPLQTAARAVLDATSPGLDRADTRARRARERAAFAALLAEEGLDEQ